MNLSTKVHSTETVFQVPVALPASKEVAPALSFWMSKHFYDKGKNYLDYEQKYYKEPLCSFIPEFDVEEDAQALTVWNLLGVLVLLGAVSAIAITIFSLEESPTIQKVASRIPLSSSSRSTTRKEQLRIEASERTTAKLKALVDELLSEEIRRIAEDGGKDAGDFHSIHPE